MPKRTARKARTTLENTEFTGGEPFRRCGLLWVWLSIYLFMPANVEARNSIFRADSNEINSMAKLGEVALAKNIFICNDSPNIEDLTLSSDLDVLDLFIRAKIIYDCIQRGILMGSNWTSPNGLIWEWKCEIIRKWHRQDG